LYKKPLHLQEFGTRTTKC